MSGDRPFGGEMGQMGDSTVEGGAGERRTRGSTMGSDIVSGSVSTGSDVTGRTDPEITGTNGDQWDQWDRRDRRGRETVVVLHPRFVLIVAAGMTVGGIWKIK